MSKMKLVNIKIGLTVLSLAILLSMAVGFGSIYAQEDTDLVERNIGSSGEDGVSDISEEEIRRDALRGRLQDIKRKGNALQDRLQTDEQKLDARTDMVRTNLRDRAEDIDDRDGEDAERLRERRADLEERRVDRDERFDERREKLDQERKRRILAYAERMFRRMEAAVERLEKIADRVETRISKLEEEHGIELTEASRFLGVARDALAAAAEDLRVIKGTIAGALDTDDPKSAWGTVRELLGEAKQSIKDAHKALVEAIKAVRVALGLTVDDGADGSDGSDGGDGADGSDGAVGSDGARGADGSNGSDATN